MDYIKISNLIKTKRKEKGLTQEELAKRINVTEKAISRWETGRGTPDISLLIPLSEELGISVSEILKGKEDKKEEENFKEIVNYIDASKSKRNKVVITISSIIYVVLLILYLWYLKTDYSDNSHISYLAEIIYNSFFITSIFLTNRLIANYYFDKLEERERMNKVSYIMVLIIYLIMLFNLTIFGRVLTGYNAYNLIPFKTILGYIAYLDVHNIIVNIIGNILVLMPVQFLLMRIFNINKYKTSLLMDTLLALLIETIQLISHSGVFDIDDIILNILGMSLIYLIITKKYRFLYNHKDKIIISFISLSITYISFEMLSWYHFPHIPTIRVFLRLLFVFTSLEVIIYSAYKFVKKMKKISNTKKSEL